MCYKLIIEERARVPVEKYLSQLDTTFPTLHRPQLTLTSASSICSLLILSNDFKEINTVLIVSFYVCLHKCVHNLCVQVRNNPEAECGDRGSVLGLEQKGPILHVLRSHAGNLLTATGFLYFTQCIFLNTEKRNVQGCDQGHNQA